MSTIRELIIQELITRAAVIKPSTYATSIGLKAYRARTKVSPNETPCINIIPQIETATYMYGKVKHNMPVKIDGLAAFGSTDPSVYSEMILGDLIKCFTSQSWDRRRPKATSPVTYDDAYAERIIYTDGGLGNPTEENELVTGASIGLLVTYWTKIGDPSAQ
jgi:hypothetical protein